MILFKSPIIVFDTETSGWFSDQPGKDWAHVIELGAVHLDQEGNETGTFQSLICPPVFDERAKDALAINHIDPDEVRASPPTRVVLVEWLRWVNELQHPFHTSFNVAFDRPFLERFGHVHKKWANCVMLRAMDVMGPAGVLQPAKYVKQDTPNARRWLWPKLSVAAEHFGITVEGDAHRALTDARTAARVAVAIRKRELTQP